LRNYNPKYNFIYKYKNNKLIIHEFLILINIHFRKSPVFTFSSRQEKPEIYNLKNEQNLTNSTKIQNTLNNEIKTTSPSNKKNKNHIKAIDFSKTPARKDLLSLLPKIESQSFDFSSNNLNYEMIR
jgi:hypothetical protein